MLFPLRSHTPLHSVSISSQQYRKFETGLSMVGLIFLYVFYCYKMISFEVAFQLRLGLSSHENRMFVSGQKKKLNNRRCRVAMRIVMIQHLVVYDGWYHAHGSFLQPFNDFTINVLIYSSFCRQNSLWTMPFE